MTHADVIRQASDEIINNYIIDALNDLGEGYRSQVVGLNAQIVTQQRTITELSAKNGLYAIEIEGLLEQIKQLQIPVSPVERMTLVYEYNPSGLTMGTGDWKAFQSDRAANTKVLSTDNNNNQLQVPTLAELSVIEPDEGADSGYALYLKSRVAMYMTATGLVEGWVSSRGALQKPEARMTVPFDLEVRLRATKSVGQKWATMIWPTANHWLWEVDMLEVFSNMVANNKASVRFHADLNGDGKAIEQRIMDFDVDLTKYHVFRLSVRPERMSVSCDGVEIFAVEDVRFIPTDAGSFGVGKALTGVRSGPHTDDDIVIDYVRIYKPIPLA